MKKEKELSEGKEKGNYLSEKEKELFERKREGELRE